MVKVNDTCDVCQHRGFDRERGSICQLTSDKVPEAYTCSSFIEDAAMAKHKSWKESKDAREGKWNGRKRLLSLGLLIFVTVAIYLLFKEWGRRVSEAGAAAIGSLFN